MSKPIILEIQGNSPIRAKSGTSRRGQPYSMNMQEAWKHDSQAPYPTRCEIVLDDDATPYSPGLYEIDYEKSVFVDQYANLKLGRLHLVPARPKEVAKEPGGKVA